MAGHEAKREFHRFDSLTELLAFCRRYYGTDAVSAVTENDELRVHAVLPNGTSINRLVVHFEGARAYVVCLEGMG